MSPKSRRSFFRCIPAALVLPALPALADGAAADARAAALLAEPCADARRRAVYASAEWPLETPRDLAVAASVAAAHGDATYNIYLAQKLVRRLADPALSASLAGLLRADEAGAA